MIEGRFFNVNVFRCPPPPPPPLPSTKKKNVPLFFGLLMGVVTTGQNFQIIIAVNNPTALPFFSIYYLENRANDDICGKGTLLKKFPASFQCKYLLDSVVCLNGNCKIQFISVSELVTSTLSFDSDAVSICFLFFYSIISILPPT